MGRSINSMCKLSFLLLSFCALAILAQDGCFIRATPARIEVSIKAKRGCTRALLDFINMDEQGITEIPAGTWAGMTNLNEINLSNNPDLKGFPANAFEGLNDGQGITIEAYVTGNPKNGAANFLCQPPTDSDEVGACKYFPPSIAKLGFDCLSCAPPIDTYGFTVSKPVPAIAPAPTAGKISPPATAGNSPTASAGNSQPSKAHPVVGSQHALFGTITLFVAAQLI